MTVPAVHPPSSDLPLRQASQATSSANDSFDIVATYKAILESDPDLTKPVVAIKALIELLGATNSSTVFETIELVKANSERLKSSVNNPAPLRAGTDLFQHNLVKWLKNQQDAAAGGPTATAAKKPPSQYPSFDDVRHHLLRNTRILAQQALDARDSVAEHGWRFLSGSQTVLTHGASRAVISTLTRAAAEQSKKNAPAWAAAAASSTDGQEPLSPKQDVRFRVIHVRDDARPAESDRVVAELRGHGIPVAEITLSRVLPVLEAAGSDRPHFVLLGAEAVTHDGGIISRMGTCQIATLAQKCGGVPVRVAAETHKFVRTLPLRSADYTSHRLLEFRTEGGACAELPADAVDYTPGELVSCLITEEGVKQPGDVMVRLLDLYGTLAN